jgi:hypothetical protein
VAGRKKAGDLGRVIGVRLDKALEETVDAIAADSALGKNAAAEVIRVIVTHWFMRSRDPVAEFDQSANAVHAWRKSYVAGLAEDAKSGSGPTGKGRKKNPRATKAEKAE